MLLRTARAGGLLSVVRSHNRRRARILAYHGVDDGEDPVVNFDGFQVPSKIFRQQLDHLARKYRVVPLSEFFSGRPLPDHAVAITFDDGYRNNVRVAAPILKNFRMPATFFVTTGFLYGSHVPWWYELRMAITKATVPSIDIVGESPLPVATSADKVNALIRLEERLKSLPEEERKQILTAIIRLSGCHKTDAYPMMNENDVRELIAMGFDVGPHTVSHVSLGHETESRAVQEAVDSVAHVGRLIKRVPICYSYPYGRPENISEAVVNALKEAGCRGAVTTTSGLNDSGTDPYRLRRLNISGNFDELAFEAVLSGLTA